MNSMWTAQTRSAEETREIGRELAPLLREGDTVLLKGDLGAGKSEFARGVARGLGYTCVIPSPTFTLMNLYEGGDRRLCHFDWYRLSGEDELLESGLDEFIGGDEVAMIEWPERAPDCVPDTHLCVCLYAGEDGERTSTMAGHGGFRSLTLRGQSI